MKSRNLFLFPIILFVILGLSSCNTSIKGKWSESDKQFFYKTMEKVDLSSLGENKKKWLDCYLKKAEANYSNFREADNDIAGCKKLALECTNEIFDTGSIKGKWSEEDKQQFYKVMEDVDLSELGDSKQQWLDCYLEKAEAKYSSFREADTDSTGCGKLAVECWNDLVK